MPAASPPPASRPRHRLRWLVTGRNMGSTMTVVGRTTMPPGVNSKHALHRHPNAEEWEFILEGVGLKHVGEESFLLKARVGTIVELEHLIVRLNRTHGVARTRTAIALSTKWEGRPQPGRGSG